MDLNFWKKEFPKKVTKTCKVAGEKSSQLIEEAKLRLNIANLNDKISDKLAEIGALVYEDYKSGNTSYADFEELCKGIEEDEIAITEMKTSILKMKKMKQCEVCDTSLNIDDKFCSKCGAEQPEIVEVEEEQTIDPTACPSCNEKIEKGSIYCAKCGAKIAE